MDISKDAEAILAMCWRDGQPRGTSFIIGEKHTSYYGTEFKATEDTYKELLKHQELVGTFDLVRGGKVVSITGRKLL